MNLTQRIIIIAIIVLGTMITRFTPFILFRKKTPEVITYLDEALPGAIFGLLVIYCLKDVSIFSSTHAIPEMICILLTTLSYYYKKNMLLSIAAGTICYMLLVQFIFI